MAATDEPVSSSEDDIVVVVVLILEYGPGCDVAKAAMVAYRSQHALGGGVSRHSDGTELPLTTLPLEATRGTESVATSARAADEAAWV